VKLSNNVSHLDHHHHLCTFFKKQQLKKASKICTISSPLSNTSFQIRLLLFFAQPGDYYNDNNNLYTTTTTDLLPRTRPICKKYFLLYNIHLLKICNSWHLANILWCCIDFERGTTVHAPLATSCPPYAKWWLMLWQKWHLRLATKKQHFYAFKACETTLALVFYLLDTSNSVSQLFVYKHDLCLQNLERLYLRIVWPQGNENHCCYHISHFLSALPNPPDAGLLPRRLKGQQATNQRLTRMHLSQPWLTMTVPFQVIFQGWRKKKCSWLPTALPWYTVPRSQKWRRHAKSPAQPQNIFNQSHFFVYVTTSFEKSSFSPFFSYIHSTHQLWSSLP